MAGQLVAITELEIIKLKGLMKANSETPTLLVHNTMLGTDNITY